MAQAYKCDVCGKYFSKEDIYNTKLTYDDDPVVNIRFKYYRESSDVYFERSIDLCPDCKNAIADVIEKRKNKNGGLA